MNTTCTCGKPKDYGELCRDCYEDKQRRVQRDAYDKDTRVMTKRHLHKERCRVRLFKNYEGPPSMWMG